MFGSALAFRETVTDLTQRRDFQHADIILVDADGRVTVLHALRATLGTQLAGAGVTPQWPNGRCGTRTTGRN
ncbi:MAG: hypothetical protein AAFV77_05745 [Planctomycetota bacterium]